jgi:division protein CdvB (Snf7/Vps24/ESCRT-III family)
MLLQLAARFDVSAPARLVGLKRKRACLVSPALPHYLPVAGALRFVKQKQDLENKRRQAYGQVANLETMESKLQDVTMTLDFAAVMTTVKNTMQQHEKILNPDALNDLHDDLAEQLGNVQEAVDWTAKPLDDDPLKNEEAEAALDKLFEEVAAEANANTTATTNTAASTTIAAPAPAPVYMPEMPEAPTSAIARPAAATAASSGRVAVAMGGAGMADPLAEFDALA